MFGEKNSTTRTEEFTVADDVLDSNTYNNISFNLDEIKIEPKTNNNFIQNIEDVEQHEKYKKQNWFYEKSIPITAVLIGLSFLISFLHQEAWIVFLVPFFFFLVSKCLFKLEFEKYASLDSSSEPLSNKICCIYCGHKKFKIFPAIKPKAPPPKHDLEYFCNACNKYLFYKKL